MEDVPIRICGVGILRVLCALALPACGGGTPLLHPAHVLAPGKLSAGAGVSRNFLIGNEAEAIEAANETALGNAPNPEGAIARGALVEALRSPGLAPWVSIRAGLGGKSEAGLTYSGRNFRVDGRHALKLDSLALSIGGAVRLRLLEADRQPLIHGADADKVTGYGFDVPILIGWQSDASVVQLWGGVRAGYDRASGPLDLKIPALEASTQKAELEGQTLYGEGLIGLAVGLPPIWVAAELGVGYGRSTGSVQYRPSAAPEDVEVSGLVLTPAGALVGRF